MSAESTASPRLKGLLAHPTALLGLCILGFFVVLAVFGPLLVPHDPSAFLSVPNQAPNTEYWLGTSGEGKDVFSQTVAGARLSLLVAFASGLLVMVIGTTLGLAAAYFGGWVDDVLSFFTNIFLMLPGLPLAAVLAAYLPPGPLTLTCVLVVTGWAWNARVIRAQALSLRHREFVLAAQVSGESHFRIVFFEMLPNLGSLLFSGFIGASVYAMAAQVGLEFLGLGDVSVVTWGTNLYWASNSGALLTAAWWTILPTGISIALVGFALVLLNGAIDELANPALRGAPSAGSKRGGLLTPVQRETEQ